MGWPANRQTPALIPPFQGSSSWSGWDSPSLKMLHVILVVTDCMHPGWGYYVVPKYRCKTYSCKIVLYDSSMTLVVSWGSRDIFFLQNPWWLFCLFRKGSVHSKALLWAGHSLQRQRRRWKRGKGRLWYHYHSTTVFRRLLQIFQIQKRGATLEASNEKLRAGHWTLRFMRIFPKNPLGWLYKRTFKSGCLTWFR